MTVGTVLSVGRGQFGTDRIDTHRGAAATETLETEILDREVIEIGESLQHVTGCEELAIEVAGGLLDAGRRVHHVPVVDNGAPAAAHFSGDHAPRVEGGAEAGHGTERALERLGRVREGALDREERTSARAPIRPAATVQVITISSPTY